MKKKETFCNGRIVLEENHCEYKDGNVDLGWTLFIDENLVGGVWKNYDDEFHQLVLTSYFGDEKPKYYTQFSSIVDGENKYNSKEEVVNEIIKLI